MRWWQRAGALAAFFGSPAGLAAPDQVYAASTEGHTKTPEGKVGSKSERPSQTVSAVAAKLSQRIIEKFAKGQEADLVAEIVGLQGTTLVCWQHEAIPAIAKAILGSAKGVPDPWPSHRFDVVWRFVRHGPGDPWAFDQICQRALSGDGDQPIASGG